MRPSPKLQPLARLVGQWSLSGTHPLLPGRTLHGSAEFEWLEASAFLVWRMRIDEPEVPDGVAIFGTDDATDDGTMIYSDVRGVSREYRWTLVGNQWRWWRDTAEFSQRMVLTIADDGQRIECEGEMSRDAGGWEPDLQLTYTRLR